MVNQEPDWWRNNRREVTRWFTVFAWLFQIKLKSRNYLIARGSLKEAHTQIQFHVLISCVLLGSKSILSFALSLPSLLLSLNPSSSQGEKTLISFIHPCLRSLWWLSGFFFYMTCRLPAWEGSVFCTLLDVALQKIWKIKKDPYIHQPNTVTALCSFFKYFLPVIILYPYSLLMVAIIIVRVCVYVYFFSNSFIFKTFKLTKKVKE